MGDLNAYITLLNYIPYILEGAKWSLVLTFGGLGIGFIIGLPVGVASVYGGRYTRLLLNIYIWIFRSTPLIVLLFLFYWGIFPTIGYKVSPLVTSILVLGLRSGAYQTEIFRGCIESIDEGQILAAYAIGMSSIQTFTNILIPQVLRISIPGWSNEYAGLLKDTAICFILGIQEVLTRAKIISMAIGIALLPYFIAGAILMILSYLGIKVLDIFYRRWSVPGLIKEI